MKRQVFVRDDTPGAENDNIYMVVFGRKVGVKEVTESRWIPVSEKPEREGRYPVVFENQEFVGSSSYWDGNNWCGYVRLWLEAPPLPVVENLDVTEFQQWWHKNEQTVRCLGGSRKGSLIAWMASRNEAKASP